ncbi:MAG: peptide-methionine (S)-S-oxide reductase MsrA [Planctomycetia bacterium]
MTDGEGSAATLETATLGGGCFWCIEAPFRKLRGVTRVRSGYTGGHTPAPTYKEICTGATGHAEVVQVDFDPAVTPYDVILDVFFTLHDPTQLNRQGADVGTQYRSVVYYHDETQRQTVEAKIAAFEADGVFPGKIVTEVSPAERFHVAEEYHQGYYDANPYQPYCMAVVGPKVAKFRKKFADRMLEA